MHGTYLPFARLLYDVAALNTLIYSRRRCFVGVTPYGRNFMLSECNTDTEIDTNVREREREKERERESCGIACRTYRPPVTDRNILTSLVIKVATGFVPTI
jgi:hypothetical protein